MSFASRVLVVRVLGSGTCVPLAKRFPSSYFVKQRQAAREWLLDMGTGALQRLAQAGESYEVLDNIFISHTHPDHCASLIPLLQALSATPGLQRKQLLTVFGPQHVKEYLDLNLDFAPDLRPTFPFGFIVLTDGDKLLHEEWQLNTRTLKHSVPTLALQFAESPVSWTHDYDTGWRDNFCYGPHGIKYFIGPLPDYFFGDRALSYTEVLYCHVDTAGRW